MSAQLSRMTTINLQDKIAAYVSDRFSDYYPMPESKSQFPELKSENIVGVIVPEEFRVFDDTIFGLRTDWVNTLFIDDFGDEYPEDVIVLRH